MTTRLEVDLPGSVRVVATTDYKGSPVTVLLVDGMEVLFAAGHEPDGLTADGWEDVFRARLARLLAGLLLADMGDPGPWGLESPTGRETWPPGEYAVVRLTEEAGDG